MNASSVTKALATFQSRPLKDAARQFLDTLGYRSDRSLSGPDSSPQSFLDLFGSGHAFDQNKALVPEWKTADLLFQLTDQELSRETSLFTDTSVKAGLLKSYVFIAIELKGSDYARGKFSAIARQINRLFPMPVMVFFRYPGRLTIAVINHRANKLDEAKDVLGKVTLISGIELAQPHRGHLDILASLALPSLVHPQKKPITDFDTLHAAWEKIFNIELLNKNFYDELANWFFWAKKHCHFPLYDERADKYDLFRDTDKVREHEAKNLIRLLTRTLFVWFIKERGLVPGSLFSSTDLKESVLKSFDPESKETNYYKAVLQNLFFATLNQTHGERQFRNEGQHQNTTTLLRYENKLRSPQDFVRSLEDTTPFLNGGLFECLDRPHPTKTGPQGGRVIIYEDGFSDRKDNPLRLPDFLFFGAKHPDDLSGEHSFGLAIKKNAEVRGLIDILDSYKFTIVENTPIDQEIALDPELLGQVFENLLASYNEETKTTARKQTGSFYTPRTIVDYMVDESLKAHLTLVLVEKARMKEPDARIGLDLLFAYTEKEHAFTPSEVASLIAAIDTCKILDPACGSGAFPMGTLQKLVFILSKLDPDNKKWQQRQIDAASAIPDSSAREAAITAIEKDFSENADDYGRKLYLIENCLYGVDIQSIATQVSKLRFFISLIVDQHTDTKRPNFGVRPLPNLESKFVTADTLTKIEKPETGRLFGQGNLFELTEVTVLQNELRTVRHSLFSAKTPRTKEKYRARDKELRDAIAEELKQNGWESEVAANLARWDPYDQNASAPCFDPEWMLGERGFDIIIGNPPYGASLTELTKAAVGTAYNHQDYQLDTYLLFVERGIQLLRKNGIQSFIIPNTWLPSLMLKSIRKFVFGSTTLVSLVDIRTAVFAAVVDTTILTHRKLYSSENCFPIYAYTDAGFELLYHQKQSEWNVRPGEPISVALTPSLTKIAARISGRSTLGDLFVVTQGSKLYQTGKGVPPQDREIVDLKPFTSDHEKTGFRPLLRGKHVVPFQIKWEKDLWVKYGTWLAEPRESAGFDEPEKIVIRQTGDTLIAALDTKRFVTMDNLYTIRQRTGSYSLPCLLALLNSSVLRWYYRKVVNPEVGEALAQVKKGHLVRLPMPEMAGASSKLIGKLANLVQSAKAETGASPGAAAFLEDLIDACVMECYFREHMAERDLLFHDTVAPHLAAYAPEASAARQHDFLTHLRQTLNAPSHPIRNRLLRLTADSPDLLAIIKQEGRV